MSVKLTNEQIRFFKEQGYLVLPSVLDRGLCAEARDLLWASLPSGAALQRDKPESHIGPFHENDTSNDPLNYRSGFRWQVRRHSTEEAMIRLLYSDSIMALARQMLGDELAQPVVGGSVMGSEGAAWPDGPIDPAQASEGIRGIYATLPFPDSHAKAHPEAQPHTDGHPFMLSVVGLIDQCPEGGGAFTVWPGSHKRLFHKCMLRYDQPRVPYYEHMPTYKGIVQSDEYRAELAKILKDTTPVECSGNEGDIVFWHHRLVHAAGENHSGVIRQAVLADINRNDLCELRQKSHLEDMWQDWSDSVKASAGG